MLGLPQTSRPADREALRSLLPSLAQSRASEAGGMGTETVGTAGKTGIRAA